MCVDDWTGIMSLEKWWILAAQHSSLLLWWFHTTSGFVLLWQYVVGLRKVVWNDARDDERTFPPVFLDENGRRHLY